MTRSDPFNLLRRIAAHVVLAMIVIHALIPLGQPFERVSGSPFSAETVEVSLREAHRAPIVRQMEAPQPPVVLPEIAATLLLVMIAPRTAPTPTSSGLGATGPPPLIVSAARPNSPRAPPAA
jgi:hypothetical protein